MTVQIKNLTGGYGKKPIIKNINFELTDGEIVGLIGLNGAGKSTTIKHILGLLTPTEGDMSISGINIKEDIHAYRQHLSYIPEAPVIYDALTLKEHIEMTAMAYSIDYDTAMARITFIEDISFRRPITYFSESLFKRDEAKSNDYLRVYCRTGFLHYRRAIFRS